MRRRDHRSMLAGPLRRRHDEAGHDLGMGPSLPRTAGMVGQAKGSVLAREREVEAVAALVPGDDREALGFQQPRRQRQGCGGRERPVGIAHGPAGSIVPRRRRPSARAFSARAGRSIPYQDRAATGSVTARAGGQQRGSGDLRPQGVQGLLDRPAVEIDPVGQVRRRIERPARQGPEGEPDDAVGLRQEQQRRVGRRPREDDRAEGEAGEGGGRDPQAVAPEIEARAAPRRSAAGAGPSRCPSASSDPRRPLTMDSASASPATITRADQRRRSRPHRAAARTPR